LKSLRPDPGRSCPERYRKIKSEKKRSIKRGFFSWVSPWKLLFLNKKSNEDEEFVNRILSKKDLFGLLFGKFDCSRFREQGH
jgi:hypothetical protein